MNRIWMVAAVPLVLMALMFFGFWVMPSWSNIASPTICVAILAGGLITGLCVLFVVFKGWWRGAYALKRGDIIVATTLATLDVLIPTTIVLLIWQLIRSLNSSRGLMF
jgi:hypothetical protein